MNQPTEGFRIGVIIVGMGGEKDVKVQIFRLNEYGKLTIETKWQSCESFGAAVGEVQVDPDERACACFEHETVLAEEPDYERSRRNLEFADGSHVIPAWDERGQNQLNGNRAVVRIVTSKVVSGHSNTLTPA